MLSKTSKDDVKKKIYTTNDKVYHPLVLRCSSIAFGLFNQAKANNLNNSNIFITWKNLNNRYAFCSASDQLQLAGEFNNCALDSKDANLDKWFIKFELLYTSMIAILGLL